jgi:hypothetical protein
VAVDPRLVAVAPRRDQVAAVALLVGARAKVEPRAAHLVARADEVAMKVARRATEPNVALIAVPQTLLEADPAREALERARRRRATRVGRTRSGRTVATTAKPVTAPNGAPVRPAPGVMVALRRDQVAAMPDRTTLAAQPSTLAEDLAMASATTATLVAPARADRRANRIASTAPPRIVVRRAQRVPGTGLNVLPAIGVPTVPPDKASATTANRATAARAFRRVAGARRDARRDGSTDAPVN